MLAFDSDKELVQYDGPPGSHLLQHLDLEFSN